MSFNFDSPSFNNLSRRNVFESPSFDFPQSKTSTQKSSKTPYKSRIKPVQHTPGSSKVKSVATISFSSPPVLPSPLSSSSSSSRSSSSSSSFKSPRKLFNKENHQLNSANSRTPSSVFSSPILSLPSPQSANSRKPIPKLNFDSSDSDSPTHSMDESDDDLPSLSLSTASEPRTPTKAHPSFDFDHSFDSPPRTAGQSGMTTPKKTHPRTTSSPSDDACVTPTKRPRLDDSVCASTPPKKTITRQCPEAPKQVRYHKKEIVPINSLSLKWDGKFTSGPHKDKDRFMAIINGVAYRDFFEIGSGKEHVVHATNTSAMATLKEDKENGAKTVSFDVSQYVIKMPQIKLDSGAYFANSMDNETVSKNDVEAIKKLQKFENDLNRIGLHLPEVLVRPNPKAGDNAFSIQKRLYTPVDTSFWGDPSITFEMLQPREQRLLEIVEAELTFSANAGDIRVGDCSPRNFMWLGDKLFLAEYALSGEERDVEKPYTLSLTDDEKSSWDDENEMLLTENDREMNVRLICGYVRNWSNGNENIWNRLTRNFNSFAKKIANQWLTTEKAKNKGALPMPTTGLEKPSISLDEFDPARALLDQLGIKST